MKTLDETKCKEIVFDVGTSLFAHQCSRNIWKDGFCKLHHPESVKERQEKSQLRWEEKMKRNPYRVALNRIRELEALLAQRDGELENLRNENLHYQMIINKGR